MKNNFWAVSALVAMAAMLAACGENGGSTPNSGGTSGPIMLYQQTLVQSPTASLPFSKTSAEAAVADINAHGGINGRKLELVTCNEAGDPNTALKCAERAVSGNYVAMVGNVSLFGPQVDPILQAAGLANIGLDVVTPSDAQSATSFPFDIGIPGYAALPAIAKKYLHAAKIATFYADGAQSAAQRPYVQIGAKLAGVSVAADITVPASATDYTQYVAQARNAGAQAIVSTLASSGNLALWKAIQSTGGGLHTVMSDGTVSQSLISQAGAAATNGDYVSNGVPATDNTNAAGKAYRASMAKYAPNETTIAGVGMRSWLAVQLFADVARGIRGPITRASVFKAMSAVHDLNFYWLKSLSFTSAGPLKQYPRIVSTTVFPSLLQGGNYVPQPAFDPFGS